MRETWAVNHCNTLYQASQIWKWNRSRRWERSEEDQLSPWWTRWVRSGTGIKITKYKFNEWKHDCSVDIINAYLGWFFERHNTKNYLDIEFLFWRTNLFLSRVSFLLCIISCNSNGRFLIFNFSVMIFKTRQVVKTGAWSLDSFSK